MVAAESLEESDPAEPPRGPEPVVQIEPKRVQGLPAERELREAVELWLPRSPGELPEQLAGATEVAAAGTDSKKPRRATEVKVEWRGLPQVDGLISSSTEVFP